MSRRRSGNLERVIAPDYKYNSVLVSKVINSIMWDGQKSKAEKIVYHAIENAAKRAKEIDVFSFFKDAIKNATPAIEVRSRRIGGATYQIPVDVPDRRARSLAIRWIVSAARKKQGANMWKNLSDELLDAFNRRGGACKQKDDKFKMAEANKAFAHFRW